MKGLSTLRSMMLALASAFTLFSITPQAVAGDMVTDASELKNIFSNKTTSGTFLKKDGSYDVYFAANGSLSRVFTDGEKESGTWRISDDGKHCVQFEGKPENCRGILAGNRDGVYFRTKEKPGGGIIKLIRLNNFRDGNALPN